jgi:4-hydroxy-3-polyprenylbenzoate decarboxylase
MGKKRIVVAVSGASGAPLAAACIKQLQKQPDYEIHLVISRGGEETILHETDLTLKEFKSLAHVCYDNKNIGASIASGTYETEGMIVVPCSMKTLAGICGGYSDNLLLRAADVTIKERRKLILVARETPLSPIHLRNMEYLSRIQNVVILPPVISYYSKPKSLEDMNLHIAGKILDAAGIKLEGFKRWE